MSGQYPGKRAVKKGLLLKNGTTAGGRYYAQSVYEKIAGGFLRWSTMCIPVIRVLLARFVLEMGLRLMREPPYLPLV